MKNNYTLIIIALIFSINVQSQTARLWATYYGGPGSEGASIVCSATDAFGNVYLCGSSTSSTGIASGGFQNTLLGGLDAFLVKFDAAGNRLWATYYGGTGSDYGTSVSCDALGNVYLGGETNSTTGIASGGFQNALVGTDNSFLVKFDASGNRLWGTYYGGTGSNNGSAIIKTDAAGNVYISSNTNSSAGIASGGFQNVYGGGVSDAYLVKFNSAGVRQWATYYGGTLEDRGYGVDIDASGNIYLCGETVSTAGISSGGFQNVYGGGTNDAFLVKFNSAGVRQWATYYGGNDFDYGFSVVCDNSGNPYLSGITQSTAAIAAGGFQNVYAGGGGDNFLIKFNPAGVRQWGTYYGGTGGENTNIRDLAADGSGNIYMGSFTSSTASIASGGFQNTFGGGGDGYLVKFDASGNRIAATYYGGTGSESGAGVCIDNVGNVYLSGTTQSTASIASGGFQMAFGGIQDAYLVKFDNCTSAPTQPGAVSGLNSFCNGTGITNYSVASVSGANSYSWNLPGIGWSGASTTNTISVTTGSGSGNLSVFAINACGTSSASVLSITVNLSPTINVNSGSICSGSSFTMIPSGASTYTFSSGSAIVSPTATNSYSVTGTSTAGCISSNTAVASVTVIAAPTANAGSPQTITCSFPSVTLNGSGVSTFTWSGPGIVSGTNSANCTVNASGIYSLVGSTSGCTSMNTATVLVNTNTIPPTVTININPPGPFCAGSTATLFVSGANTYTWSTSSNSTAIVVSPTTTTSYSVNGTNTANGCIGGNTQFINVNPLPTITANTSNSIICGPPFQGTATLTASGASTYTWNTTATTTAIAVSPSVTTSYTVTGTDSNGCVNTTSFTQSVSACAGINQLQVTTTEINVYPNPFNNKITVITNGEKQNVQVFNILGSLVFSSTIETEKTEIDLSNQTSGIYFIRIGSVTKKIIKE